MVIEAIEEEGRDTHETIATAQHREASARLAHGIGFQAGHDALCHEHAALALYVQRDDFRPWRTMPPYPGGEGEASSEGGDDGMKCGMGAKRSARTLRLARQRSNVFRHEL
jgi:hypothetical protein